jgi:hypothetical protein
MLAGDARGGLPPIAGRDFYPPASINPVLPDELIGVPYGGRDAMQIGGFEPQSRLVAYISDGSGGFAGGRLVMKTVDEASFKGLIDIDEFSNSPAIMNRLSRARQFDIGGYHSLTGKGQYGRLFNMVDSDEALQNLYVRYYRGVEREATS